MKNDSTIPPNLMPQCYGSLNSENITDMNIDVGTVSYEATYTCSLSF